MDIVRKKTLGRYIPRRGKDKRLSRTDSFLKRQSPLSLLLPCLSINAHVTSEDKVWLETHIWHAKRMHMENLWGYRLVCIFS